MNEGYPGWRTLREIDADVGAIKGSAFRAFKRLLPELREERDFVTAAADRHPALYAALCGTPRVYPSSFRLVLLAPAAAARVRVACAGGGG